MYCILHFSLKNNYSLSIINTINPKSLIQKKKKKEENFSLRPKWVINISSYHKKLPSFIASEIDDIVQSLCPDMIKSIPWKTVSLLLSPPPHVRTKHQHINIFTIFVNSNPRHHPPPSIPFSSPTKTRRCQKTTFIEQKRGEKISVSFTRKKLFFSFFKEMWLVRRIEIFWV